MWYWKGKLPKVGENIEEDGSVFKARKLSPNSKNGILVLSLPRNETLEILIGNLYPDGRLVLAIKTQALRIDFAKRHCEWRDHKKVTNRQWLAKMSDEELADWLKEEHKE